MKEVSSMCGIGGIVRWGKEPIKEDVVGMILVDNEKRGNDSSGLVIQKADGSLNVIKKDIPGWRLVTSDEYATFRPDQLREAIRGAQGNARGTAGRNSRVKS